MGMSSAEYERQRHVGRFRILATDDLPDSLKPPCTCVEHGDGSSGRYCYRDGVQWHVVEFNGDAPLCIVGSDGGEPEDQLLVRNWQWVAVALNRAYDDAIEAAAAECVRRVGNVSNGALVNETPKQCADAIRALTKGGA